MSGQDGHGDGASNDVNYGKIIGVGVGSLVIFAFSIWWSSTIYRGTIKDTEAATGHARPVETHRAEIGIVDQIAFSADQRLPAWRRERKHALESYGWVDKSKGVVRIPIETAMDKVAGGAMPAGAPR